MSKELLEITEQTKELRITSVELVEIINQFREEEFEILKEKGLNKKDKYVELRHDSFMTKIRKELEVLETLGLEGHQNILESSYINKQNKEQPCFSLNRDGMLQMLNSESAIVRAKTIEYINELEQKLINANNSALTGYLNMSEEDRAIAYFTAIKQNKQLEEQLLIEGEKSSKWDEYINSDGLMNIRTFGAIVGVGQNDMFNMLRENGYLQKNGENKNVPYRKYLEQGIFEVKAINCKYANSKTYLTRKGVD
ncbi:phage antirepressor KilAC domain-containing protein, partial [Clostridium butyricum]|uniref:phage antirepressor KilAC domain-containing protein n=1 Tax=Clostridium butyricum TaxID=1492 RepID=UPI00232ED5B4